MIDKERRKSLITKLCTEGPGRINVTPKRNICLSAAEPGARVQTPPELNVRAPLDVCALTPPQLPQKHPLGVFTHLITSLPRVGAVIRSERYIIVFFWSL